jgi:hypothetical protein
MEVSLAAGLCRLELVGSAAAAVLRAMLPPGDVGAWLGADAASAPRGVLRAGAHTRPLLTST